MDDLYKKFTEGTKKKTTVDEFMDFLRDSKLLEDTGISEKDVRKQVADLEDASKLQLSKVKEVLEEIVKIKEKMKSPLEELLETSERFRDAFEAGSKAFFETLKKGK